MITNTDIDILTKDAEEYGELIKVSKKDKDLKKMLDKEFFNYQVTKHVSKNGKNIEEVRKVEPIILQRIQLLATLAYSRKQDRTNCWLILLTIIVALFTIVLTIKSFM